MSLNLDETSLWIEPASEILGLPEGLEKKPGKVTIKGFSTLDDRFLAILAFTFYPARTSSMFSVPIENPSFHCPQAVMDTVESIAQQLDGIMPFSYNDEFLSNEVSKVSTILRLHVVEEDVPKLDLVTRQSNLESELSTINTVNKILSDSQKNLTYSTHLKVELDDVIKEHLKSLYMDFRDIYSCEGYQMSTDLSKFVNNTNTVGPNGVDLEKALIYLYTQEKPLTQISLAHSRTALACKQLLGASDSQELVKKGHWYIFDKHFYSPTHELGNFRVKVKSILSTLITCRSIYKECDETTSETMDAIHSFLSETSDFQEFESRDSHNLGLIIMECYKSKVRFKIHEDLFHWIEMFIVEHE